VNRQQRLVAAGVDDTLAGQLAALPAADVDRIVRAVKSARRAALDEDKQRRRQRVADRREHRHIEDATYARAADRMMGGMGRRASASLDALEALNRQVQQGPVILGLAVEGCRSQGYSDAEIGRALGVTRQRVGQRFGRKQIVDTGQAS
jgi:DNA-directed RNA polymerase specialized sigma24 family protein